LAAQPADSILVIDDDEARAMAHSAASMIKSAPALPYSVREQSDSRALSSINTGSAVSSVSSSIAIQALQSMHEHIRRFRERRSRVADAAILATASASPWASTLLPEIMETIAPSASSSLTSLSASSASLVSDELHQFAASYRSSNAHSSTRIVDLPVSMLRALVSDLIAHVRSTAVTRALESLVAVQLEHSPMTSGAQHQTQDVESRAEQHNSLLAQLQRMYWQTLLRLLSVRTSANRILKCSLGQFNRFVFGCDFNSNLNLQIEGSDMALESYRIAPSSDASAAADPLYPNSGSDNSASSDSKLGVNQSRWWLTSWDGDDDRSLWTDRFRARAPAELIGNESQVWPPMQAPFLHLTGLILYLCGWQLVCLLFQCVCAPSQWPDF
jgi:hypothetical protein